MTFNNYYIRKLFLSISIVIFCTPSYATNIFQEDSIPSPAVISKSIKNLGNKYNGIDRIVEYNIIHPDIPTNFEGCKIAFISDTHYKSLFTETGLKNLTILLHKIKPNILLMGGDYQEGCQYVKELFDSLETIKPDLGIYGVLGNNDYERCTEEIRESMKEHNMKLLEQISDTIFKDNQKIIISGIENSTTTDKTLLERITKCPTLSLSKSDFVILLTHTPDYAQDNDISNTDIVLAGHTHGGQVLIFGHAPKVPSKYGERFLTGLKYTSKGVPMIITNGIGTSQIPIRIGAPSEIVLITLHSK
jgi:predicted MPP superfamily phosphohydrolase